MQRLNNLSIKNKLILIQSATAFIAVLFCAVIFVLNDIKMYKESAVRKMTSVVRIVGENSISPLLFMDKDAINKILQALDKEPDIKDAIVLDKTGKVFGRYIRHGTEIVSVPIPDTAQITFTAFSGKNLLVTYKILQEHEFLGTIMLRTELTEINKIILNYIVGAAIVLIAGLFAALLISIFLQRTISSRLLLLVSKTKTVSDTADYSIRVSTEGKDEIATLSKGFNNMLEQIEKMEASLEEVNRGLENRIKERTIELETSNKELESFSYSVSHDLRAPVRAINGFIRVVEKKYQDKLDEEGRKLVIIIINEAARMGRLIDDLLAFSRLGRREIEKTIVDMTALAKEAINESLKSAEEKYNAKITVKNLPPVMGDTALIRQVWINLISNALKFSRKKTDAAVEIGSFSKENSIVYFVKDNGVGFDMKYYDKLFGVFQRLHSAEEFEGTGIGLAIVKRTIIRLGGSVWGEGKLNEGAVFYFSLPSSLLNILKV